MRRTLARPNPVAFEFNAMLLKGWVADERQRVRLVNRVLRDWLRRNHPLVEARLNSVHGVPVVEFLGSLMEIVAPESQLLISNALDELGRHLNELPDRVNEATYKLESEFQSEDVSVTTEIYTLGLQRQSTQSDSGDFYRGAEIRASVIGGFPLAHHEHGLSTVESVDIVIFGQLRWEKEEWKLVAYQGLFERAADVSEDLRVQSQRSGALALIGRNQSHNIGSHALYWLEQASESLYARLKAQEVAAGSALHVEGRTSRISSGVDLHVSDHNYSELSRFFKYVRERMELLAGLVTDVPLALRTFPMTTMVEGFERNLVLLRYLCKSEGVEKIDVTYKEELPCNIALPGGSMGMQLFYSLLENIIRDNAKYGPHGEEMDVTIEANEVVGPYREECVMVRVIGQQADNVDDAVRFIGDKLSALQITDARGTLLEGVWGIKERYIAAYLLRGLSLRDLDQVLGTKKKIKGSLASNPVPIEDKPILTVLAQDRRLVWEFYILKGKDVLLIRDEFFRKPPMILGVQFEDFGWLRIALGTVASIRHSFVVVWPVRLSQLKILRENRRRLPYRTFLVDGGEAALEHSFVPLREDQLKLAGDLATILYKAWNESLDPHLSGRFLLIKGEGATRILEWNAKRDRAITQSELRKLAADPACLGIFSRHWPLKDDDLFQLGERKHCEVFGNTSLHSIFKKDSIEGMDKYALFESILIRVLVIDERLDRSVGDFVNLAHRIDVRGRLEMKGIFIYGRSYGESNIPTLDTMIAETTNRSPYHFVCVHRGILDKLKETYKLSSDEICAALSRYSKNVLIHSGRVGRTNPQDGISTIPLSNVVAWKGAAVSKMDVVNELCSFRRPL